MTETHVAGLDLTWDGRYLRQRCAWCGAILIDQDLSLVMVQTPRDGGATPPDPWPVGEMVRRDGHAMYRVVPDPSETGDGARAPEDSCFRLDPEATT